MAKPAYYTLMSSLPPLEDFERSARVPITRLRLDQRLTMLDPAERKELGQVELLIAWHAQPLTRTGAEMAAQYDRLLRELKNPVLRHVLVTRMDMRTILAGLRMRHRKVPATDTVWGVGRWVKHIREHWDQSDFGLSVVHPWIPGARAALESGDALELERLTLRALWKFLSNLEQADPFAFEQVVAYVFKWDVMNRWLSNDAEEAAESFQNLVSEVVRDHQNLFASK